MSENAKAVRASWLHVRLTPREAAELRERAQREGRPVSDVARAGLALILAGDPAPAECAHEAQGR